MADHMKMRLLLAQRATLSHCSQCISSQAAPVLHGWKTGQAVVRRSLCCEPQLTHGEQQHLTVLGQRSCQLQCWGSSSPRGCDWPRGPDAALDGLPPPLEGRHRWVELGGAKADVLLPASLASLSPPLPTAFHIPTQHGESGEGTFLFPLQSRSIPPPVTVLKTQKIP